MAKMKTDAGTTRKRLVPIEERNALKNVHPGKKDTVKKNATSAKQTATNKKLVPIKTRDPLKNVNDTKKETVKKNLTNRKTEVKLSKNNVGGKGTKVREYR